MTVFDSGSISKLSQSCAFLGNSYLTPMTDMDRMGLDPSFWQVFPDFEDAAVRRALNSQSAFCVELIAVGSDSACKTVADEFGRLFAAGGAVDACEGVFRGDADAAAALRSLLSAADLQLQDELSGREDHIGVELLYLAESCRRAQGDADIDALTTFAAQHPALWIDDLLAAVQNSEPKGYFVGLTRVAAALMHVTAAR